MKQSLIFYPVLAQIFLTFIAYIHMTVAKNKAIKNKQVNEERRALHKDAWPDSVIQVSNNIQNQFESPILFYSISFMLWALQSISLFSLVLAWIFVLIRFIHYYVHTGSNYVPMRKRLFMLSSIVLFVQAMNLTWVLFNH